MPKTKPVLNADKILVGTGHDEGTHMDVIHALRPYNFSSLGIEVSPSALEKSSGRKPNEYFVPIISYYRNRGVRIVPLDLPQAADIASYGIMIATDIALGKWTALQVQDVIARSVSGRTIAGVPVEVLVNGIMRYREKGADGVLEQFRALSRQREDHMVNVILENDVPVNIIGAGHVVEIAPRLPAYLAIYPDKTRSPLVPQLQSSYIPSG